MTIFYLDFGWIEGDGDPGLALTDVQKALFPTDFINGIGAPLVATIGLEVPIDGTYYYEVTLTPDLTSYHPWHSGYWLCLFEITARVPDGGVYGWSGSGNDVQFTVPPPPSITTCTSTRYVGSKAFAGKIANSARYMTSFALDKLTRAISARYVGSSLVWHTPRNRVVDSARYIGSNVLYAGGYFLALAHSTENKSFTTYNNFPFTGSCNFKGETLLINNHGLYEYGGTTDDGTAIVPSIKTGVMDFGSQRRKRVPTSKIYIDADKTGGSIDLTVTVDDVTADYTTAIQRTAFASYPIKIGRGLDGIRWGLEIIGNGCSKLDIASIEFEPEEIRRRGK